MYIVCYKYNYDFVVCLGMIVVILLMVSMVFVLRNFNLGLKDKGTFNIIAVII